MEARAVWSTGRDAGRTWFLRAAPACAFLILILCSFVCLFRESSAEELATTPAAEATRAHPRHVMADNSVKGTMKPLRARRNRVIKKEAIWKEGKLLTTPVTSEESETKLLSQGHNVAAIRARSSIPASQALSFIDSLRPGPWSGQASGYLNAGPDCYNLVTEPATVPRGLCTETCVLVWEGGQTRHATCHDREACFWREFMTREVQAARAGIPRKFASQIAKECDFETKSPHLPLAQFEHMFLLSATNVQNNSRWDVAAVCSDSQRLAVAGALVGSKDVVRGVASEVDGCESVDVTSQIKQLCAHAIQDSQQRCVIGPDVFSEVTSKFSCATNETPYLALYVNCVPVKVADEIGCKLYTPATGLPSPGGCECPAGTEQCVLKEASMYTEVAIGVASGFTVHAKNGRGFKNGDLTAFKSPSCTGYSVRVACKKAPSSTSKGDPAKTSWLDRGPDCYSPTDSNTAQMCKFACLKLWNPTDDSLVNVHTPFDDFMTRLSSGDLTVPELTDDGNTTIRSCKWEYKTWTATGKLKRLCTDSRKPQIVRAFVGCSDSLRYGKESNNCNYLDITNELTMRCGSAFTNGTAGCTLHPEELLSEDDACQKSCTDQWGIQLYYSCTLETSTSLCSLNQTMTGLDESENEYACGCPYLADMCDLEEAEANDSWKDTVRGFTVAILKGNLTYGLSGGSKRYHSTSINSYTCQSPTTRVLCKPPPATIEIVPPSQVPDCNSSFSIKKGATSSDDSLCVNECSIVMQRTCASAANVWLCVGKTLPNCFVPNRAKTTCVIESSVGAYQASFQSCSCPNASMPCTEDEVEVTRYEWEQTFTPEEAFVVVAPQKVLGPGKTIQPDYGMAGEPGCGSSRYKRVFCRGASGKTGVTRYDETADCENATSLDSAVISDSECHYACSIVIKKCKATIKKNPDAYESEYACYTDRLENIPKLSSCLIESKLVDPETGVGSLEAGYLVVTQQWTSVSFKKEIENAVVVTSLPSTTNAPSFIQIKDVTSTGFKIRMKNDFCSVGLASPYTTVGWLASGQGVFVVSGAKRYVRVGTTIASLNQTTTIRYLPRMNSATPLVLLQHQDSGRTSGDYIVAANLMASSSSEATFQLTTVGPGEPEDPLKVGYMVFDEIDQDYCSLSCQLNGIALQTVYENISGGWTFESTDSVVLAGHTVVYGAVVDPSHSKPVLISRSEVSWFPGSDIRSEGGVVLDWGYVVPGGKDTQTPISSRAAQNAGSQSSRSAENSGGDMGGSALGSLMQMSQKESPALALFSNTRSGWYPAIDIINNSRCTTGSVSRTNRFPNGSAQNPSKKVALLYVSSGTSELSSSNLPSYGVDCASASGKAGSATTACIKACQTTEEACTEADEKAWPCFFRQFPLEQKRSCQITAVASDAVATSTSTPPPVDHAERCVLVDMREEAYSADRGWDPNTMTCKCPNGAPACSAEQATYNLVNHSSVVLNQGTVCASAAEAVFGIARQFKRTTADLCGDLTNVSTSSWEQLPFPPYMADDVNVDDEVLRSGYYLCSKTYNYVFCPSSLITTTTTTPAPKWDWPADRDCVPGEWTSWSKCSMDCYPGSGTLPTKSRTRPVLLARRGTGAPCALEEQDICNIGSEVPYCEDLCWITEWGDWSGCEQKVLQIGHSPVRARTKLRHIFMGTAGVCGSETHVKYDYSGCTTARARDCTDSKPACVLDIEPENTLRPPVCFLSRTRQVDATKRLSYLATDKDSGRGSCMCAATNSVPCSPEEVALSFDDWSKQLTSDVCPFGTLGAFFNSPDSTASADSFVYFGAADLGRVHCPISKSSDLGGHLPTFAQFESPESMNSFCENGLPFWKETLQPVVDCRQVVEKQSTTMDCHAHCQQAVVGCTTNHEALDKCIASALSDPKFTANCELRSSVKLGKGLMFCKHIRTDCKYSEWSEWSGCSLTCRTGRNDEESIRIRDRSLLVAAEHGGHCDADIEDSYGWSLNDVQVCDWLPDCPDAPVDGDSYVVMPKSEPQVGEWSPTRTTTTTEDPSSHEDEDGILCTIVDMADFSDSHRGYDPETESCTCPYNTKMCSRTEAANSRDNWEDLMDTICNKNNQVGIYHAAGVYSSLTYVVRFRISGQILAKGMEEFTCTNRVFRSSKSTLSQTPEEHCKSSDATYLFCKDGAIDSGLIFTQLLMAFFTGVVLAFAVVYWAIQYSGDVQKVLGFTGRYVELSNLLNEVSEAAAAKEEQEGRADGEDDEALCEDDAEPVEKVAGEEEMAGNAEEEEEMEEDSEGDALDDEEDSYEDGDYDDSEEE
ncbi:hypothetical protein NCLIV_061910 [Neospora caninum Liverpool]|uniref:Thrombospondin type 1 domain-containing protein n=1 Tax=Neospora caninum (strain Liverpool) TaxID=572307 RepID=F0VPW9_NEOCL|nr:hypothetical protein NCLIV_061910 [Neospora caninum Liverpool]CBZ55766.1 hypothetical protein NCLIV_061910 [Neospora caninum Liverpool]|eukprot:XP_003885792.1 hypothetical protein NCLIV_061910 [Neospora caninum Liverpool]